MNDGANERGGSPKATALCSAVPIPTDEVSVSSDASAPASRYRHEDRRETTKLTHPVTRRVGFSPWILIICMV